MKPTYIGHFDLDAIDGDGRSRHPSPVPVPFVSGEPEHGNPLTGVILCAVSLVVSLAVLMWGAGQLLRAMLR